jgi:hypothetical protein
LMTCRNNISRYHKVSICVKSVFRSTYSEVGIYFKWEVGIEKRWNFEAGMRIERMNLIRVKENITTEQHGNSLKINSCASVKIRGENKGSIIVN